MSPSKLTTCYMIFTATYDTLRSSCTLKFLVFSLRRSDPLDRSSPRLYCASGVACLSRGPHRRGWRVSGFTANCYLSHSTLPVIDPSLSPSFPPTRWLYARVLRDAPPQLPVVVVGGGLAGLAASIEASRAGAQVTLLEKGNKIGGNSAKATSGAIHSFWLCRLLNGAFLGWVAVPAAAMFACRLVADGWIDAMVALSGAVGLSHCVHHTEVYIIIIIIAVGRRQAPYIV